MEELLRLLDHWMLEGLGLDRAGAGGAGLFCGGGRGGGKQSELEDSGIAEGGADDSIGVGVEDDGEHSLESAVWMWLRCRLWSMRRRRGPRRRRFG